MLNESLERSAGLSDKAFVFNNHTREVTAYFGSDTEIVIPEIIEGVKVESIGPRAFAKKVLTKVTIPSSVKVIKERAFSWCNIVELNLSEGLISVESSAFAYNNIEELFLPDSVEVVEEEGFANNPFNKLSIKNPKLGPNPFGDLKRAKLEFRDSMYSLAKDRRTLLKTESGQVTAVTVSGVNSVPEGVHILASRSVYESTSSDMKLPSTLKYISDYAFDFVKINKLIIPSAIEYISPTAFEDISSGKDLILVAPKNSYVEKFAKDFGYKFEVLEPTQMSKLLEASSELLSKVKPSNLFRK